MHKKELTFAIIGCGVVANMHAEAIKQIKKARLLGTYSPDEESKKAFAFKHNIKGYSSLEDLLADPDIDIVSICTPSGLHASQAILVARASKHIIVEKPMAINMKEAREMIDAVNKHGVKMAVISQQRFREGLVRLKDAVDKGELGRIVSGDIYMKYYRSEEYYKSGGWRGTKAMDGGGALMNQGIHGVDSLQYVMGPVKSVFAHAKTLVRQIEVEDLALALLEFESGATGVIQATTCIYPGMARRMEVSGSKGTIILEEGQVIFWEIEGKEMPKDLTLDKKSKSSASDPSNIALHGHIEQITDMVEAVLDDRTPLVDQYEGIKPLAIILAIYESARTGKLVRLGDEYD